MNMSNVKHLFDAACTTVTRHSPEILTGIGIAGMFTAIGLAVTATPKAISNIEEAKEEQQVETLPPVETVKATWKCYIPAAVTAVSSAACLIGASSISLRRNAALATAYAISETALSDYRNKVVETVGEKKETEIRKAVARDKVKQAPVNEDAIIYTNQGTTLCYDALSGRHFYSDMEVLKRGANEVNRRMRTEMFISVNQFYQEIGLPPNRMGDDIGWHIDRGYVDPVFDTELAPNGKPCLVMDFCIEPKPDLY